MTQIFAHENRRTFILGHMLHVPTHSITLGLNPLLSNNHTRTPTLICSRSSLCAVLALHQHVLLLRRATNAESVKSGVLEATTRFTTAPPVRVHLGHASTAHRRLHRLDQLHRRHIRCGTRHLERFITRVVDAEDYALTGAIPACVSFPVVCDAAADHVAVGGLDQQHTHACRTGQERTECTVER